MSSSHIFKNEYALTKRQCKVEDLRSKIKRVEDIGSFNLKCKYVLEVGDKWTSDHKWICYKYKDIRAWFDSRIVAKKYWYECKNCYFEMTIKQRMEY